MNKLILAVVILFNYQFSIAEQDEAPDCGAEVSLQTQGHIMASGDVALNVFKGTISDQKVKKGLSFFEGNLPGCSKKDDYCDARMSHILKGQSLFPVGTVFTNDQKNANLLEAALKVQGCKSPITGEYELKILEIKKIQIK